MYDGLYMIKKVLSSKGRCIHLKQLGKNHTQIVCVFIRLQTTT